MTTTPLRLWLNAKLDGLGHLLPSRAAQRLPPPAANVVESALGLEKRNDPVLPRTGGPAGNAQLTAAIGLLMLVLIVAELVTLLNVRGLLTWHVAVGTLLIPPAFAKTATTGWRVVRYYCGHPAYRLAGPPPVVLRLLGPLVVAPTMALLGSGVVLVLLGQSTSHTPLITLFASPVNWVTVHQAAFVLWAVVTGVHVLARLVPAVRITLAGAAATTVPGSVKRASVLISAAAAAVIGAVLLVQADGSWANSGDFIRGIHAMVR